MFKSMEIFFHLKNQLKAVKYKNSKIHQSMKNMGVQIHILSVKRGLT